MPDAHQVPAGVRELATQFAPPHAPRLPLAALRQVQQTRLPCADRPEARHGPYYSLTRALGGRTQSWFVPAPQAELVRRQLEAERRFRRQVDAFWEACEEWADA